MRIFSCLSVLVSISILYSAIPTADTVTNSIGMKFKRIPAGSFLMGYEGDTLPESVQYPRMSSNTDLYFPTGIYNEKPRHRVTFTDDFYMGVFETRIGEYKRYNPAVVSRYGQWDPHGDDNPVYRVTWFEADSFCRWLTANDPDGWTYRLPTEAEWEYACRAGTVTRFYSGDSTVTGWFNTGAWDWNLTTTGRYAPNPWGLCDMLGNVAEWCYDWYGPFTAADDTNPGGYDKGLWKVQKGLQNDIVNGWSTATAMVFRRCAARAGDHPFKPQSTLGFRVVISRTSPVIKARTDDTLAAWQKLLSISRPTPATPVSGAIFTDADGRRFFRVPLKSAIMNAPYPSQRDSIVYVSESPISAPDNADRKSAGLFARSLSLKFGVLYRISNRYEAAFAGIPAVAGDFYLTIVPDLAYKNGQPHPDVSFYSEKMTPSVEWNARGSDGPILWGMVYAQTIRELPNGDLCIGAENGVDEDGAQQANNMLISLLPNGSDAWSPWFVYDEQPNVNGGYLCSIYGDPWTGRLWSQYGTSPDNGQHWSYSEEYPNHASSESMFAAQSTVKCGNYFPLSPDTLQNIAPWGNVMLSADSGRNWTKKISPPGGGIIFQVAELDDGRTVYIPRAGGDPDECQQYINDARTGTIDSAKGPFFPINCCSIESRMIKLHSGRLLHLAPRAHSNEYVVGESVDSAKHWFVRRVLPVEAGEGMIIQSRDGVIHALFERNRFSGGSHSVFSFTEEWLREGTVLPFSQWGVTGNEARTDTLRLEPDPLPPMDNRVEAASKHSSPMAGILISARPNPFTPTTTLHFSLPGTMKGSLTLFNVAGRQVRAFAVTGPYGSLVWDGKDALNRPMSAGYYLLKLKGESGGEISRRILLLK